MTFAHQDGRAGHVEAAAGAALGAAGKQTRVAGLASAGGDTVYRSAVGPARAEPAAAFAAATQGRAVELPYRADMERLFGQSFANVKVHLGAEAQDGLDALGANAAAQGEAVAFATPTPDRKLVAHELAHVVQRRRGGAATGGMSAPGDAAEVEAEAAAARVAAGEPVTVGAAAPASVHRDKAATPGREAEKQASRSSPGEVGGTTEPATVTLFNYAIESAELKPEHQLVVTELRTALAKVPKGWLRAVVIGHADDSGDPAVNGPLSKQRAEAVRRALATSTVPVAATWHGERQPVAPNTTSEGRSKNRRVVVELWPTRALPGKRTKPAKPTVPKPPKPPKRPKANDDKPEPKQPEPKQPEPKRPEPKQPEPKQREPRGRDKPDKQDDKDDDDHIPICPLCGVLPFIGPAATSVGTGVWWVVVTGGGIIGAIVDEVAGGHGHDDDDHDGNDDHDKNKDKDRDKDKDKDDKHGGIRVDFDPINAANTPAKMSARLSPGVPRTVGVHVTGWSAGMAPIRVSVVTEEGSGTASINGQQYLDLTGSTTVTVVGREQTAQFVAERLHLGAMYEASSVGASNEFAIAALPQNVRVEDMGHYNDHPDVGGFKVMTHWESDSGNLQDLNAVRFGETVETVVKVGKGATDSGWQRGRIDASKDGIRDNHTTGLFDHGEPWHSVHNQVWMFDDQRTDSGEQPVPHGGFRITRDVHRDISRSTDDKVCYEATTTKAGASLTAFGRSTSAGRTDPSPITVTDAIPCNGPKKPGDDGGGGGPGKPKKPGGDPQPKQKPGDGGGTGDKAKATKLKPRHVVPMGMGARVQTVPIEALKGSSFEYVDGVPRDPTIGAVYKATMVYRGLDGELLWAELDVRIDTGFDADGWIMTSARLPSNAMDMNPTSNDRKREVLFSNTRIALHESYLGHASGRALSP